MKPIRTYLPSLLTAALLIPAPLQGVGSTIHTNLSIQPQTRTEWTHDFILPQFDPSLGTLEAVHLTLDYQVNMSGSLFNPYTTPQDLTFQAGSFLTVTLPGSGLALQPVLMAPAQHYTLAPLDSSSYGSFSLDGSAEITLTGAALASFVGSGNVVLPGRTATEQIRGGSSGKAIFSLTATSGATLTLEYFDTQVPEPSSGVLLAVALGALSLLRRRRG